MWSDVPAEEKQDATAATILVVDDNPAGRYATSRVLRSAGFGVLEAGTGMEGVVLAPGADLVILDVNLPDISGFDVCKRIRSAPETARVPVIHLSATFVRDADKVHGLEAGADGYLTHPVEPPVLVATVNAFLRTRRAEEAMRRSEAKFKAIFDQALSGILLVSKDLVYLEANPAACRMLGHPREEIVGKHTSAFVPAGHEQDTAAIARELEERGAWHGMIPLIRADGAQVELEWNISRHSVPGVRLAVVTDVTERKAHEAERERLLAGERAARGEAERANRIKDEFLATLSHELRTPLNAIVGWSQILRAGQLSADELAEGIDAIDRNAQAQAQLISDLLDVSRITSGKLRLDAREMNAAATLRDALEAVAPSVQARGVELRRSFDPSVGAVWGDPQRVQQVVWNLVNNAVKFTPRGGTVAVELTRDGGYARIAVSDTGQGIKPDFLPHIFERFRQEDATTKRNQGGLGLGLSIVKHLVEMHGGTVTAESAGEGRGATFTVRLPLAEGRGTGGVVDAPEAGAGAAAAAPVGPMPLRGVRVLVVDDDGDARAVLKHVLARAGAEVREAADVSAALDQLAAFRPGVLLSDVGMPRQDGYDLIRAVRGRGYSAEELPAIALTAFARSEDRSQSLSAGFQVHLSKPVHAHEVVAAVAAVAGGK